MEGKNNLNSGVYSFNTQTDVYILGDGGFAREIKQLLHDCGALTVKMIGKNDDNKISEDVYAVLGVGDPRLKEKIIVEVKKENRNIKFLNLIHPWSMVGDTKFGEGNVICAGTIFTVNINVGNFNAFNLTSTIGHDCKIGNFNQINPGTNISGGVTIENNCLIGTGVQILENINICSETIIGAGSVVTKDITEPGIYVGIPARKIVKNK